MLRNSHVFYAYTVIVIYSINFINFDVDFLSKFVSKASSWCQTKSFKSCLPEISTSGLRICLVEFVVVLVPFGFYA